MNLVKVNATLVAAAATAGVLGCSAACYLAWRWRSARCDGEDDEDDQLVPPPESTWREVGVLADMMCFPIKSCGVVRLPSMECTRLGLKYDLMRDRTFLVVDETGSFRTARIHPRLILIAPRLEGNILVLEAPDMAPFRLDLSMIENDKGKKIKATQLWDKSFGSVDCGNEVAKWISKFILNVNSGLRLVHYSTKPKSKDKSRLKVAIPDKDSGAYPDYSSFNLMNEASVDDLNERLVDTPRVDAQTFRPNFVVRGDGLHAYDEDRWQWVRIGDVVFKVVKYCTRCTLTTVDHRNGTKNEKQEPLATLRKYRMVGTKPYDKRSPVLGVHLIVHEPGWVNVGDKICVVSNEGEN